MSDQSTPDPGPSHPEQPAADTAALPPQQAQQQPQPAQPAAPGWSAAPTAAAPAPPGWVPPAGPPSGPRRWWSEATSTGGGRAALGLAAALAALVVVVGIGLTAALVVSHHGERGFMTSGRDDRGRFDEQGPGNGMGPYGGQGRGNGQGNRNPVPQLPGQGAPVAPGAPGGPRQGMGMGAGAALGAVLHGEFTTSVTGTPTVMVVQTGQVTAYTAGKSLAVKSTDGFTATYTLDGTAPVIGNAATPVAVGATVRVVAAKEGMKVTAVVVG